MKKKLKTALKKPNDLEKLYPDFLEEGKKEISAGNAGVFCQNLGITAYTLENYSNLKIKFLFNNDSMLETNYHYNNRSKGNVIFTELSEIINTLSNLDFAGMDKFKLNTSPGEIKEMTIKMNKTNKSERN